MPRSSDTPPGQPAFRNKLLGSRLLNGGIVLLAVVVGYLSYSLVNRVILDPPVEPERSDGEAAGVIQIDVLNACGDAGMAAKCSAYLRARGFDVVEMKNYKTFDLSESIVIDRTGAKENAERVAKALGIPGESVIQQISHDYYVDVSVVIGKDYPGLKPY